MTNALRDSDVRVMGLGIANPPARWDQGELLRHYETLIPMSADARGLLEQFFSNDSIRQRYLALESPADALETSQDALAARFRRYGAETAERAARRALEGAGIAASDVDALIVNTCTGYLCPGLSSYLAEGLGLRGDVWPFDLMGMGCGGAIPNLQVAANFVAGRPGSIALSVAVEICSATLFFDESPDILLSNAIFGDGAAAVVVTNGQGGRVRLLDFAARVHPEAREALFYRWEAGRLRNVLSRRVPVLGARFAGEALADLLKRNDLKTADIGRWIVHPGGEKVLQAFEREMGLPPAALAASRRVLREHGNMSSASVLFVLHDIVRDDPPPAGTLAVMCSFGAGFTAFAALVEFMEGGDILSHEVWEVGR